MKKALIVSGGWDGHQPEQTSALFESALQKSRFSVEVSTSLDIFLDPVKLQSFDLIIPNWTMGQITGDQEKNLAAAIESGIGLAGFHGGMGDAFRNGTLYQFMVGGQFVAHPDNHKDYTVHLVKKSDPILDGLSDFAVHSEQYFMHIDPTNEVLATTTFQSTSAPWINGAVMPVVWKRHYGKGRVFYQSIGHSTKELEQREVFEITLRGMLWATR